MADKTCFAKLCVVVPTFLLLGALAFAQNYYEVPYAGTRSRLTKLTAAEEDAFIKENAVRRIYDVPDYDKLKRGEVAHSGFFTEEEGGIILGTLDIYAELAHVYKEEIPDEKGNVKLTVYRAMYDFKTNIFISEIKDINIWTCQWVSRQTTFSSGFAARMCLHFIQG